MRLLLRPSVSSLGRLLVALLSLLRGGITALLRHLGLLPLLSKLLRRWHLLRGGWSLLILRRLVAILRLLGLITALTGRGLYCPFLLPLLQFFKCLVKALCF